MAKVRVYELARKYEISSEALRKILVKEGITVKSHMSTIDDKVIMLIEQHLKRVRAATSRQVSRKKELGKGKPAGEKRGGEKEKPKPKAQDKTKERARVAGKDRKREKEREQEKAPGRKPKAPAPGARAKDKRPRKVHKRTEADQKAVKESVKRTLAKLDIARKSRRRKRKEDETAVEEERGVVKLPEFSTVADVAEQLDVDPTEIIQRCLGLGLMVSINQRLDSNTIAMIADEYGFQVKFVTEYGHDVLSKKKEIAPERLSERPPVVTIMGHVDHGKTSLLDNIRNSNIIAGEKGGITQHIGAYEVAVDGRRIAFIDTPGHKAFTAMRSRGAQATDIVVLIVAADDGVMPQTIEAINHARAADVPIIVAVNKVDLPSADTEKVKRGLLQHNIVLEEYGGNIMGTELSAKTGAGVRELLEMILTQAEMMELKADPEAECRGIVLEARKEEGRGIVCTVLIQQGTLEIGDVFITGNYFGRVKALLNERGSKIDAAPPSTPVVVLGCSGVPQAGDAFYEVENERAAREIAQKRQQFAREKDRRTGTRITLEDLYRHMQEGRVKELNLILRADTDGSAEALGDSLGAQDTDEVKVNILHRAVGMINESDILLASASNAVVIGFNVPIAPQAQQLAKLEKVDVRFYDVIYQALDDIKAAMAGLLEPEIVETQLGEAEVRQVFSMSRIGTIAGSYVTSGVVRRGALVRVRRDGAAVHEGTIGSLKRFKEDVREVQAGFECGIGVERFDDIREGDILEVYVEEEKHRTFD